MRYQLSILNVNSFSNSAAEADTLFIPFDLVSYSLKSEIIVLILIRV